jgi:flagellar biosynthesis component FlhA
VAVDDQWRLLNALVIFDEAEQADRSEAERLDAALASVRRELGDRITLESCNLDEIGTDATAVVYETERSFEQQLERWPQADLPEMELRAARRSVWDADVSAATQPVIVTSGSARPRLRRALEQELPDVTVLARAEIPPDVGVVRAGSVRRCPESHARPIASGARDGHRV